MLTRFLRASALTAALTVAASHAGATVLDQEFVPGVPGGSSPAGVLTAQTFTAGITGTLDSVTAHIVNFGGSIEDLTLAVYSTAAGEPSTSLGSVTLDSTAFPTNSAALGSGNFTAFDFLGLGIAMQAGFEYALVVTTPETQNKYSWRSSTGQPNQYAGGQRYVSTDGGVSWTGDSSWDYAFQTFVNPASVPEPMTLALLLGAIGAAAVSRRRRRPNA